MWHNLATTELDNLENQLKSLVKQAQKFYFKNQSPPNPYNKIPLEKNLIQSSQFRLDKIPNSQKKEVCKSYFEDIKSFEDLKDTQVSYTDQYKIKHFLSSENVSYSYDFNQCGLRIEWSVTQGEKDFQDRHTFYGQSLKDLQGFNQQLRETIQESYNFLHAKTIKKGEYPVIFNSEITGVFTHESFGHSMEADFEEASKTKQKWKIGDKVASECVSIVDHGGEIGTSGYCPIDDEGFLTQKTYIIKKGVLQSRLHSQHTAHEFDEAPTGNSRAINFEFHPIVRMTNTYIEPGVESLENLIESVKLGVFVKGYNYGTGLSTFTIAPSKAYMIREGKLAEPVSVSVMTGKIHETLKNIKACSKNYKLESSAFGGCGKDSQSPLPVGLGGPEILVEKMMLS